MASAILPHRGRRLVVIWCALMGLLLGGIALPAQADDLDNQKSKIDAAVKDAKAASDGSSKALADATERLNAARQALVEAEAAVVEAQAVDEQMALELKAAQADYDDAARKEQNGQFRLEQEQLALGEIARAAFQQSNDLINIATLLNPSRGTADLANRVQWMETALATNQAALANLERIQTELATIRQTTATAQAKSDQAKQAAQAHLQDTQDAEVAARLARDEMAAAEEAAKKAAEQDKATLAAMEKEQKEIEDKIWARDNPYTGGGGYSGPSSYGLVHPVPGAVVTSGFGYRQSVLGTNPFHDGIDFGIGCGTPIRAAAAGVVTESYWSTAGWGYRMFVDHGSIGGVRMTTGYNHMRQLGLAAGTWVSQGQTIGYVGTTGTSTGCHLHWHLLINGTKVNGLNYL